LERNMPPGHPIGSRFEIVRRSLTFGIIFVMMVWFVGGAIRFPDSPIHPCPNGYCGKQGQRHTEEEYRLEKLWSRYLIIGWPIGMFALILLNRKSMAQR
jgi:hypothetical protein